MGIDKFYQRGVFPALSVGGLEYVNGTYPTAGKTYFVSKLGNNSNGLNWKNAFTTLATAIAANNTDVGAVGDTNWNKMNRIYVDGGNYDEALTVFPNHCEMIGVGAAPARVTQSVVIAVASPLLTVCHIYNMYFRTPTGGTPAVQLYYGSQGVEFHNCQFLGNAVSPSYGLQVGNANYALKVIDCEFLSTFSADIGIAFDGPLQTTVEVIGNFISAVTHGIYFATPMTSSYQVRIKDNIICRSDGNYGTQLVNGIYQADTGNRSDVMIVNNWIFAATPLTGQLATHCSGNHTNIAGAGHIYPTELN